MDSASAAGGHCMLNTNQRVERPVLSTGDMSLQMIQIYLLKNAKIIISRTQYFTKEELKLFAVNPTLEPGQ